MSIEIGQVSIHHPDLIVDKHDRFLFDSNKIANTRATATVFPRLDRAHVHDSVDFVESSVSHLDRLWKDPAVCIEYCPDFNNYHFAHALIIREATVLSTRKQITLSKKATYSIAELAQVGGLGRWSLEIIASDDVIIMPKTPVNRAMTSDGIIIITEYQGFKSSHSDQKKTAGNPFNRIPAVFAFAL